MVEEREERRGERRSSSEKRLWETRVSSEGCIINAILQNPYMLYMMGTSPENLMKELKKFEEFEKIKDKFTEAGKAAADASAWSAWIAQYRTRVQEMGAGRGSEEIKELNKERMRAIKGSSPKYVLRNYIAQEAIAKAEKGDYSEVESLLKRFHDPYP